MNRRGSPFIEAVGRFILPERGQLRAAPFAVVAALGAIVGTLLSAGALVQRLEWALYDRFTVASAAAAPPAGDIVVVAIDQLSFEEVGLRWPWPRSLHAALIDAIAGAGAQSIALDIIFDRPASDPMEDELLVDAVARAGNVVLASDLEQVSEAGWAVDQWVRPFPQLADAAHGVGVAKFPYDPDGAIRRAQLTVSGSPSLAAAAAGLSPDALRRAERSRPSLIPFVAAGRSGFRTVSYYQALDPEALLPSGIFQGKHVLVGVVLASAPQVDKLADQFRTPISPQTAGVEVHANVLNALLHRGFIADPFAPGPLALGFSMLCAAAAALAFARSRPLAGLAYAAALIVALAAAGFLLLSAARVRIPVVGPAVAVASMYLVTTAYRFSLGRAERRMILSAFKHYLAPALVDSILKDPSQLRLGGAEYDVTIIFTDLAGFTSISERLSPDRLRELLTTYFKEMMNVLLDEHATLDKFIGDAIMVYFGCPIASADHAMHACRAAVRMQRRLAELNRSWALEGHPELRMRVGINSGRVVAGNMGTDEIFNFTILGDSVNLASRLEGVNKSYGTRTLMSEFTRERIGGEFAVRELDWIRVKGKERPVAIFELLGGPDSLSPLQRLAVEPYEAGLRAYRARDWSRAAALFRAALLDAPGDCPSRLLAARCEQYAASPPPADWDGVYVMTTK